MTGGDVSRFSALGARPTRPFLVAVIAVVAWLARAGSIVNFISESVMIGFKLRRGPAFSRALQLPKLFGFKGAHGSFWERTGHFFSHLHLTNAASLYLGLAALAILVLGKIFLKNKPIALFVVIGSIVAAAWTDSMRAAAASLGKCRRCGLPALFRFSGDSLVGH